MLIDLLHSAFIVLLVVGTPLLYIEKAGKLRRMATWYAIIFIVVNRLSQLFFGRCIWTKLAQMAGGTSWGDELFLSKASRMLFGCIPTDSEIWVFEHMAIVIVLLGILVSFWHDRRAS